MKIYNIKDVEGFFNVVDKCKGQVHVVSPEGDDIVLTSKLSRVVFAVINEEEINNLNLELKCENSEDTMLFMDFLARG